MFLFFERLRGFLGLVSRNLVQLLQVLEDALLLVELRHFLILQPLTPDLLLLLDELALLLLRHRTLPLAVLSRLPRLSQARLAIVLECNLEGWFNEFSLDFFKFVITVDVVVWRS